MVTFQRWPTTGSGKTEPRRLFSNPSCVSLGPGPQSRGRGLLEWRAGSSGQGSCCRRAQAGAEKCLHLEHPPPASPPWPWNGPSSAWEHLRLIHLDPSVRKVHFRPSLTFPGGKLALTSQSVCDISIKRGVTKAEPLTFGAVHQW